MTLICKNCNQHFNGQFCNYCGQSADTHEINTHFLWHDIQHGLLHFDKGILFTLKELFTRPGYTIREFIEGKRVKHIKPISFIFFLAGIYGFLMHYFDLPSFIQFSSDDAVVNTTYINKVTSWVSSHYAFTTLLMLPLSSLGTFWAFKKQKYNFVQHVVLNSYLSGLRIVLRIVFFPLILIIGKENGVKMLSIPDIIGIGYTIWALFQFFDNVPTKSRIMKVAVSYIYIGLLYIGFVFLSSLVIKQFILHGTHS